MKFRRNKKGFTIVELVIVIAVIGILTAVMVPTIVHLVNKANKAADEVTVNGLNKALALRKSESSYKKPSTMHETVEGLLDYGYKADSLIAKSDEEILYDLDKDEFLLKADKKAERLQHYWKVQKEVETGQEYNIYATKDFAFKENESIAVGFDAGESSVSSVSFKTSEAKDVVIRTNSLTCDLEVEAGNSKVKHYGEAQSVQVKAIKSESYHEYGAAPFISVTNGRVVLEDAAEVEALHVNSSSAILAIASDEKLPAVSVEEGVTSFKVQTTVDNTGDVTAESNVTVAAGVATLDTEITAMDDNTPAPEVNEEEAKGEAVANSDLVFQVKGSWGEVAASARAVLNDYLRVYNTPTSVLPGGSSSSVYYTPAELSNYVVGLKDYYVEAGTIHIDVESITINGIELNATSEFGLSVGSKRQVKANYFKIENSKLYLAAPVAAFELNTSETLKINKTNVTLGDDVENTLTVKTIHNGKTGPEYPAHENDAYSFDISKAITNNYTSMAFNEITGSADGPIVTRKLYTFEDGTRTLGYGLTSIDGPSSMGDGNYGVWMYVTGSPVNSFEAGTHLDYSVYFMGADKTCALHFDIVD